MQDGLAPPQREVRIFRDARLKTEHVTVADPSPNNHGGYSALTLDELEAFCQAARNVGVAGDAKVYLSPSNGNRYVDDEGRFGLDIAWREDVTPGAFTS